MIFTKKEEPPVTTENPYLREKQQHDTLTKVIRQCQTSHYLVIGSVILLLLNSGYDRYEHTAEIKEVPYFIMLDRDHQPVEALTKRADVLPDSDTNKQGYIANFLAEQVKHSEQIFMDAEFVTASRQEARMHLANDAATKFKRELEKDPWARAKRERVIVKIDGWPAMAVDGEKADTWLVNWTEQVQDAGGTVLREEKKSRYYRVTQNPKARSRRNIYGLVAVDTIP